MPNSTTLSLRSRIFWRLYKIPFWKKALVTSLIIIAIITLIGIPFFWRDASKVAKFSAEMVSLSEASEDGNTEELNKILNRTVSKDKSYLAVERGIKDYIKAQNEEMDDLIWMVGEEGVMSVVDASSIQADDASFTASHALLNEAREVISAKRDNRNTFFTEEGALSFLDSEGLDESMVDTFLDYTYYNENSEAFEEAYNDILDTLEQMVSIYDDALNILAEHPDEWHIEDDSVHFATQELYDTYTDKTEQVGNLLDEYIKKYESDESESETEATY